MERWPWGGEDLGRILTLSDVVVAATMVFLAADLRLPILPATVPPAVVGTALSGLWPRFLALAIGFAAAAAYWMVHQRIFHTLRRYDRRLFWLNTLFLLTVALLPFAASAFGTLAGSQSGVTVYALDLAIIGLALAALWWYATTDRRLVDSSLDTAAVRGIFEQLLVPAGVYLFSILIAFLSPALAVVTWVGVLLYSVYPPQLRR